MPWYTITEPHPSVSQNTWTHSGRGGAGNHFRAPATTSPSGVATAASAAAAAVVTRAGRFFYSGRGGAGNAHAASKRHVLDFDEEYRQAAVRDHASGHTGRGGAGNVFKGPVLAMPEVKRKMLDGEQCGPTGSNGANRTP